MHNLITSHDLSVLFASTRREAQGLLPHLVRRLILASCDDKDLPAFSMPAGDDIRVQGWDGKMSFSGVSPFVPSGASVWEMGVSSDPEAKADQDYAKRKAKHPDVDPSVTTFVFVTPHVWTGQSAWVTKKKADGFWADVCVIDGVLIATWLERAPGVAVWLGEAIGRSIRDLQSPDRLWEVETNRYSRSVSPDVVIGGRLRASQLLRDWLLSSGDSLSVVGETVEEARLFIAAVCRQVAVGERSSRVLFVSDASATEHLATLSQDHVVALTDPALYPEIHTASLTHLRILVPEKRDSCVNNGLPAIQLGDLLRTETTTALCRAGLMETEANRAVLESKGSLQALLWIITRPDRGILAWTHGRAGKELAPLVLAGQWTIADHPDHEVIEQLTRKNYSEVSGLLAEWSGPGYPLEQRGQYWDWKAWSFNWSRLAPLLEPNDIERYLAITREVLSLADPALELPPEERWLANVRGKVHRHSDALREGLAQSLALLAIYGETVPGKSGQAHVTGFVRSLLQSEDLASRWLSIADWLPDLAEAAPNAFLDSLERFVEDLDAVKEVFTEGGMFGSSPHTSILWALERLVWSKDYFSRVVLSIGRLAAIDPGGKLANRPARTLREILLPWYPASGAPGVDRLAVLRLLFQKEEKVAWECASSLLPQSHDVGGSLAHPKWRGWDKVRLRRTPKEEYWQFEDGLVDLLLKYAGCDGSRWATLVEHAPFLCQENAQLGQGVTNAILSLDFNSLDRQGQQLLGDATRELVLRHKNMQDTDWAMKGDLLATFERIERHLTPHSRRDRDRWLFVDWPEVPQEHEISFETRSAKLNQMRQEAVSEVIKEEGFDAMFCWADEVEQPESIGRTLADSQLSDEMEQLLLERTYSNPGTASVRPKLARLGYGYVYQKATRPDAKWRDSTAAFLESKCGANAVSLYLLALPLKRDTWEFVKSLNQPLQDDYWATIRINVLSLDDLEAVTPLLLKANRPYLLIDLIGVLCHSIKSGEISTTADIDRVRVLGVSALNAPLDHTPEDEFHSIQMVPYRLEQIFALMENSRVPREQLVAWEWKWLPFLEHGERGLRMISAELSDNAEMFLEMIKVAYRPRKQVDNEVRDVLDEDTQHRAMLAHRVLDAWDRIPGVKDSAEKADKNLIRGGAGPVTPAWSGDVDHDKLRLWIEKARTLAAEADRLEVCDQLIGRQFAYAPANKDGTWPCTEVCEIIEAMGNSDIEQGMAMGVFNRRGTFTGGSGDQEAMMAKQFKKWGDALRVSHPRTAAILRTLSESYEQESKREADWGRRHEYDF